MIQTRKIEQMWKKEGWNDNRYYVDLFIGDSDAPLHWTADTLKQAQAIGKEALKTVGDYLAIASDQPGQELRVEIYSELLNQNLIMTN